MKRLIPLLAIIFLTLTQVSCSKDDDPAPNPCVGVTVNVTGNVVNGTSGHSDGNLTVTGTGGSGFTYNINGGAYQSSGLFTNLAAGTYTVIAKNSNGCTGSATFTLTNHFIEFKAALNGANESTPNTSTATGNSVLVYDSVAKIFAITTNHTVVTPTAAHIHKGVIGVAGSVVFGFPSSASPINFTSVALTPAQETDLKSNLYYVNVHTATYPAGEIRGQLIRQ